MIYYWFIHQPQPIVELDTLTRTYASLRLVCRPEPQRRFYPLNDVRTNAISHRKKHIVSWMGVWYLPAATGGLSPPSDSCATFSGEDGVDILRWTYQYGDRPVMVYRYRYMCIMGRPASPPRALIVARSSRVVHAA